MSDGADDVVVIPKRRYNEALQIILKQRDKIKQQEYQMKAQENLSDLLCKKDRELSALKDRVASLTAVITLAEIHHRTQMVVRPSNVDVNQQVSPPDNKLRQLEKDSPDIVEDSAPYPCFPLQSHLEADEACFDRKGIDYGNQSHQVNKVPTQTFRPKMSSPEHGTIAENASAGPWPETRLSGTVSSNSKPGQQQMPVPSCLTPTTAAGAITALKNQSSHVVSKDLLDKVMQQNARLKKVVREILHQNGLSVTDHLDKREYEDIIGMLRSEIRRKDTQIDHLRNIISVRNSDKIDQMAQICTSSVARIAELERKIALLQTYKEQCEQKLSEINSKAPSSSAVVPDEMQEEMKMLKAKLNILHNTVIQHEANQQQAMVWKREKEELMVKVEELAKKCSAQVAELESLKVEKENMDAEKQTLLSQVAVFQEDFGIERKEKMEQKERYENALAKHQEWIRRLASEAQNWRTQYDSTRQECCALEERLKLQISPSTCRIETATKNAVVVDCPRTSLALPRVVSTDGGNNTDETNLHCPRCDREFKSSEKAKYNEHCQRCRDE